MKIRTPLLPLLFLLSVLMGCTCLQGQTKNAIFQVSTIVSLLAADYDGKITMPDLKKRGNFGIGTFDGLDGEMVAVDGKFYHVKENGVSNPAEDSMRTPFAFVTFFEADKTSSLEKSMNYKELEQYLSGSLPNKKIFYAIKISGDFNFIKVRSGPKQTKPYPPFGETQKQQKVFEFRDLPGVMVGFLVPNLGYVNPPGYHFHFLSEDRKRGGHLLDCEIRKAKIEIDPISNFNLFLSED